MVKEVHNTGSHEFDRVFSDNIFTASRSADVVVWKDDGTVYADGKDDLVDSGSDASSVIQSAINHISKGKIKIDNGNYTLSSTLNLSSNILLEGSGFKTTNLKVSDIDGISVSGNTYIRDLKIENTSNNQNNSGIIGNNINTCKVSDVLSIGHKNGFAFVNSIYVNLRDCGANGNTRGYFIDSDGTEKSHCWLKSCFGINGDTGFIIASDVDYVTLDSCMATSNSVRGMFINSTTGGRVILSDCNLQNPDANQDIKMADAKKVKVLGGGSYGSADRGITAEGGQSEDVEIINFEVASSNEHGILVDGSDVFIKGCFVKDANQNAGGFNAIQIFESNNVDVKDCQIVGTSHSNSVNITSGSSNCHILGNRVEETISDSGSGNIVRDNIGYKTSEKGTDTQSGDGTTSVFQISHNLAEAPSYASVEASSEDASTDFYVSGKSSSSIEITYAQAPPSGTDNLSWEWEAEV